MTTPTEDEARARIIAKLERVPDSDAVTLDKSDVRALLASRVSTPPSGRVAGLREAADIADRMYAGTDGSALEKAWIGGCMATAAAIRNRVQEIEGVAPAAPPTDEDEREALANLIESSKTPMGGTLLGSRPQFQAIADAILAAGFRRQAVSTPEPEWEYGVEARFVSNDEHYEDVECGSRQAAEKVVRGVNQTEREEAPDIRIRAAVVRRRAGTKPGPWEPVPAEGEA